MSDPALRKFEEGLKEWKTSYGKALYILDHMTDLGYEDEDGTIAACWQMVKQYAGEDEEGEDRDA